MTKETQDPPDRRANPRASSQNDRSKRMPHERDELPGDKDNPPRGVMKQAASDLAHGLVDTDLHGMRGVEQAVRQGEENLSRQAEPQADAAEGMRHQNSTPGTNPSTAAPTNAPKGSKK